MRRYPELKPSLWDLPVILAVAAAAVVLGFCLYGRAETDSLRAVVTADGAVVETVELDRLGDRVEQRTLEAGNYTLEMEFSADGVMVSRSDCPTQDCVKTGTIRRGGQSIVCLPAKVIIRLEGGNPAEAGEAAVDTVIG